MGLLFLLILLVKWSNKCLALILTYSSVEDKVEVEVVWKIPLMMWK